MFIGICLTQKHQTIKSTKILTYPHPGIYITTATVERDPKCFDASERGYNPIEASCTTLS